MLAVQPVFFHHVDAGKPRRWIGLVVSFSYLWSDEAAAGHVEGRKARPSAIVMAVRHDEDRPPQVNVFTWPGVRPQADSRARGTI